MKDRRLGVYICYCGGNISDYVDCEHVREAIANEPNVTVAKTTMFACSVGRCATATDVDAGTRAP